MGNTRCAKCGVDKEMVNMQFVGDKCIMCHQKLQKQKELRGDKLSPKGSGIFYG